MDDPDSLRIQFEIAVLQHQQNLVELGLHKVDVIKRRRKRIGHRRFWVRTWIGRRLQFGLNDQLLVELRNEDQASFKNFMRMPPPPEMFDELLTRVGPRITKQNTNYREALDPGLKLALTPRHLASGTKYHPMSYGWRVPHNIISLLIPKVCQAIIDGYKANWLWFMGGLIFWRKCIFCRVHTFSFSVNTRCPDPDLGILSRRAKLSRMPLNQPCR